MIDPETDEMGWADRLIVLDGGRIALTRIPQVAGNRAISISYSGDTAFLPAQAVAFVDVEQRGAELRPEAFAEAQPQLGLRRAFATTSGRDLAERAGM